MSKGQAQRRTDIQALRTLAVLSVVIYHLWPHHLIGGFMGVDVFFVISGYLMTATLMRHIDPVVASKHKLRATGNYLSEFYARRIKRLVPAAAVTLLAILGLVTLTGNLSLIANTSTQIAAAAVFTQNLLLASESVDYLAAATPPTAVQHFWSLSLEEQFYLIWPVALLLIVLATLPLTLLYKKTKISGATLPIAILIVISFLYGYLLTKTNAPAAYFVTFARVWELLLGAAIVFLPLLRHYDLKLLLPWLGTAMISYAIFKWDGVGFPGWHALVPTLGTALILYAGATSSDSKLSFTWLTRFRPIQWIGDLSYSLYLWHWPLIVLIPPILMIDIDGKHGLMLKLSILACSFILAWLSYKFIEQPTQRLRLQKRWIYIFFATTIGVLVAIGLGVAYVSNNKAEARLQSLHSFAMSSSSPCLGARALADTKTCGNGFNVRNAEYAQLTKSDMFTRILSTSRECLIFHPTPDTIPNPSNYCDVGDTSSSKHITIWGDSHANQWINAFDAIGRKNNIKFTVLSSGQCAGMDAKKPYCQDRMNFIRDSKILESSDAIIVALWYRYGPDSQEQPTQDALSAVRQLTNTPVYLLQDTPPAGKQGGPDCAMYGLSCKNSITSAIEPMYGAYKKAITDGKITLDHIIPTQDMFCDDTQCYSFIGGLPVYQSNALKDDPASPEGNAHITATYSLTLAPLLENRLRQYELLR